MGFRQGELWQTYLMKWVKTYFLVSLVAKYTIEFMHNPNFSGPLIATIGLLTLYSYLVGNLQRKQLIIQINNRMGNFANAAQQIDLRLEMVLVAAGLIYFTLCLFNHQLPENKINLWFYTTINDVYDTPFIGWIIVFVGILFLIGTLLKAANATRIFIQNITGNNRNDNNNSNNSKKDEGYSDYEVMD